MNNNLGNMMIAIFVLCCTLVMILNGFFEPYWDHKDHPIHRYINGLEGKYEDYEYTCLGSNEEYHNCIIRLDVNDTIEQIHIVSCPPNFNNNCTNNQNLNRSKIDD